MEALPILTALKLNNISSSLSSKSLSFSSLLVSYVYLFWLVADVMFLLNVSAIN